MKKLIVAAVAGMSFVPAFALTEYELDSSVRDTVVDWTSDASYKGGKAPDDPSDAKVTVGVPVKVNATTAEGLKAIKWVYVSAEDATLEIDSGSSDLEFEGAITGKGVLVKKGTGKVQVKSAGGIASTSTSTDYDYQISIDVQAGTFALPNKVPDSVKRTWTRVMDVHVAEGAIFVIASRESAEMNTQCSKLTGKGEVTAPAEASVNNTRLAPSYQGAEPCVFEGPINGDVRFYSSANIVLANTNSTMCGLPIIYGHMDNDYAVSVVKLGNRDQPSSIGLKAVTLQEGSGHLRYIGPGETSDKEIRISHSTATENPVQGVIDGGPNGGLELAGNVGTYISYALMQRLVLTGTNRNECVFSGSSEFRAVTKNSVVYTNRIHVTKTGSGTWRFAHNDTRDGISGVTVKEGVLAFDTLGEIGEKCSFGTGLLGFYPDVCELYDPAHRIPYQFILGDAASETVGTLALAASNHIVCTTRPIAVAGCGSISNGQDAVRVCLAGVSPLAGANGKTLVLEGCSAVDNVLMDVTNDVNGTLSVVKRGPGRWILAGNQTFGGDLRVEGGELVVRKRPANAPFTYFRVTLKENWAELPYCAICDSWAKNTFILKQLALYDAEGNNRALPCVTRASDYRTLAANEVAYCDPDLRDLDHYYIRSSDKAQIYTGDGLEYLAVGGGAKGMWSGGLERPYLSKPETHVRVDFRVPEGAPVVSLDFLCRFGFDDHFRTKWPVEEYKGDQKWNFGANVKIFNAEGSLDGLVWEPLFDQDVSTVSNKWVPAEWYYGDAYSTGAAKGLKFDHTVSLLPAATVLPNVGTVSVSGGGTLRIEGEPIEIDILEVNPLSGGTISNVTFAANGTLVVRDLPDEADIALPGTYQDVTGFEEIAENWTLDAGRKSKSYQIVNRNGELHLLKKGLVLIFR